jgi:hypothetical protein
MFTFKNSIKENATITDSAGYFDFTPLFIKYENLRADERFGEHSVSKPKRAGFHYVEAGVKRMESYVADLPEIRF